MHVKSQKLHQPWYWFELTQVGRYTYEGKVTVHLENLEIKSVIQGLGVPYDLSNVEVWFHLGTNERGCASMTVPYLAAKNNLQSLQWIVEMQVM